MPNPRARELRVNSTDAERRLWSLLRERRLNGHKFRRQVPIGSYIADFACFESMLIVEADRGQHADNPYDQRRTNWLQSQGWCVVRFWNSEILRNPQGIAATILQKLEG
jgi:very-short-patch-repair endonuclease